MTVLAIAIMMIATTAIIAQRGKRRTATAHVEQVQTAAQRAHDVSTESLTSPSQWNKEYIHGPGGKVIATEERLVFTDVSETSDFFDDIYRIAARGVTVGCATNPPRFCPDDVVTREQMAAFIIRGLGEFNPPPPASQRFTDVPGGPNCIPPSCTPSAFFSFIDRMAVLSITLGCQQSPPLMYCPADPVKHQEMAAFIMRAKGEFSPPTPPTQRFNDVPPANVFYNFIERMGALDIWQGQGCAGTNNYCPGASVTRRQMAHILVRAFGI